MAKVNLKSQVLSYLHQFDDTNQRRTLSPYEALGLFRCFRLAAEIRRLKDDGYKFTTSIHTDVTGKRYARYALRFGK